MDQREFAGELMRWKSELEDEVIAHFRRGDENRGKQEFERWKERLGAYLNAHAPKEAQRFEQLTTAEILATIVGEDPLHEFMRENGDDCIAFIESLADNALKGRVTDFRAGPKPSAGRGGSVQSLSVRPETDPKPETPERNPSRERRIFVVYGRNEKARKAMFDFLRSLDLDPVEWPRAVVESGSDPNPHIDAVLRAELEKASGVVVMLTPDDIAHLRPELTSAPDARQDGVPMPQPRQNVLYEAGMAMYWNRKRTVLVQIGAVRVLSDIAGRFIPGLSNSAESRTAFRDRLDAADFPVTKRSTDFLKAGDFDGALIGLQAEAHPTLRSSPEDEKRRLEIAAEAANAFEKWCAKNFKNVARTTALLIQWVESGWTANFHDFDFGILKLMVEVLQGKGLKNITCPTEKEFSGALQKWHNRPRKPNWVQDRDNFF